METKSVHLNFIEYDFIKNQLFLLPMIPVTSKNIDITYYHDNFLGDYNLNVKIEIPLSASLDTQNNKWTIMKVDSLHRIKVMYYNDSQS